MMGTLEQAGTGWRLRFTRDLAHPAERVWRAVTEPGHLAAWFPMRIHGDWVVGGPLTFTDPEGRGLEFTGKVLAYQPPSMLEFSWGPGRAPAGDRAPRRGLHAHLAGHVRRAGQGGAGRGRLARLPGPAGRAPGRRPRAGAGAEPRGWPEVNRDYAQPRSARRRPPSARRPATARTIAA